MKRLTLTAAVVVALVLAAGGTAYAFDCIRVSTSARGVQSSAKSGNWLPFIFDTAANVDMTFNNVFDVDLTPAQAACFASTYAQAGQPRYFSLGIGVAGGGKTSSTNHGARVDNYGVLVWNNKNYRVLTNGRGIDHIEDNPILPALFSTAQTCGVVIPDD